MEDKEKLRRISLVTKSSKFVRQQGKFCKQNFQDDIKKVFELVTKSIENISQKVAKTITET